jgi:hypothetical protein
MIHNVSLALCIAASLAVLWIARWTLSGNRIDTSDGIFSGHALSHAFDQFLGARRHAVRVVVRTPNERSLPGGWSLIDRAMRARRDIRLAAR